MSAFVVAAVGFCLMLALTRRPVTSLAATSYAMAVIVLASWVKQSYLGLALTLADLEFFLLKPVENFKLFFNYPTLAATLIAVWVVAVAGLWLGARFERPTPIFTRPRVGPAVRAGVAGGSILLGVFWLVDAASARAAGLNNNEVYTAFLTLEAMAQPHDWLDRLNIFFDNRCVSATLPTARHQTRFPLASAEPQTAPATGVRPDIMMVLEESTFDPTLITKCPFAVCDSAMLHPLQSAARTEQGPLLVHTTGGGTWLAEFALLSGFDWRVFGRGGAFAPISVAPRLNASLPKLLRSLGYRTVAVYPVAGNFLSAQSAYGYYGFEEFYSASELQLPDDWLLPDRLVFDKALALANRGGDERPVFLFVLTIRNHGPHGKWVRPIPEPFLAIQRRTGWALADYLGRMSESSQEYLDLAQSWLRPSRPRVIGWFGDHQPDLAREFTAQAAGLEADRLATNVSEDQLKYLTRYQFSANYAADGGASAGDGPPNQALDISFLGAEMLAFAGLPLDAGAQAGRALATQCHGLMLACGDRALVSDYLDYRIYGLKAIQ